MPTSSEIVRSPRATLGMLHIYVLFRAKNVFRSIRILAIPAPAARGCCAVLPVNTNHQCSVT